jgi:tetratricopeptide (TPR) repeat protein
VLQAAEDLLDLDSQNAEAYQAMGKAFEAVNLPENAIWSLEEALAVGAPPEATRQELARLHERSGQFTRASEVRGAANVLSLKREQLQRELAAQPGNFDVSWALADLNAEYFRRDFVIATQKLREKPDDPELQVIHERLAHEVQVREIALWQQKADRYPSEPAFRFQLGVHLLKAGQLDEALSAFEQIRGDPDWRWRSLVYAAYCHLNRRKWNLAKPLLEEALPLIPEEESMRAEVQLLLAQNQ